MFQRYKLKRKMLYVIELLKEYFKNKDTEVYSALCNAKRTDIKVWGKGCANRNGGDEISLICTDTENTICIDFDGELGTVKKVITKDPYNIINVEDFHEKIGLDGLTYCTLDMIIDYLTRQ